LMVTGPFDFAETPTSHSISVSSFWIYLNPVDTQLGRLEWTGVKSVSRLQWLWYRRSGNDTRCPLFPALRETKITAQW